MNRYIIILFSLFNVALIIILWKNWKLANEINHQVGHSDVFVPTNEWQRIKKDQAIPRGLHVRINLQTGEREAKLLSNEEQSEKLEEKTSLAMVNADINEENLSENLNYHLLKESLKNIPDEMNNSDIDSDQIKTKFRSYEELKKDMSELNLQIKTDIEILNELVVNFNDLFKISEVIDPQKEIKLLSILKDLEYLLHQVDNAVEFSKINGISDVIIPCLYNSSIHIRTATARILASATQNNPVVQIASVKAGVISPLLKNIALEKTYEIRSSSIYALSCVIRGFPFSEIKLIEEGGLSVFLSLFDEDSMNAVKLQLKVVTFFNDLLLEKEDAELTVEEEKLLRNITEPSIMEEIKLMTEKVRQYKSIELLSKLIENGWCSKLYNLLVTNIFKKKIGKHNEDNLNHDVADTVLNAILAVSTECEAFFKSKESFKIVLEQIYNYYLILSSGEDVNGFYSEMYNLLDKLYTKFRI